MTYAKTYKYSRKRRLGYFQCSYNVIHNFECLMLGGGIRNLWYGPDSGHGSTYL